MNTLNLLQVERALQTVARISRENEKYFCDLDGEMVTRTSENRFGTAFEPC
jgi:hypothetical protein